jgi:hypothetical protein
VCGELLGGSSDARIFRPLFDDELALPDLAQWVAFYSGYDKISAWAWTEWDRLYEVRQRMLKLSGGRRENKGCNGTRRWARLETRRQPTSLFM